MKIEIAKLYTPELCKANPNKLYIFGDNCKSEGHGGQAIIRDEPNSFGIPTKLAPYQYMRDNIEFGIGYGYNRIMIKSAINLIIKIVNKKKLYNTIVFPKDGLGTGLAELPTRAPKTFAYLCKRLYDKFRYDNLTGTRGQYGRVTQNIKKVIESYKEAIYTQDGLRAHCAILPKHHLTNYENRQNNFTCCSWFTA